MTLVRPIFVFLGLLFFTIAGCGNFTDLVPVEGAVTLDNEPLPDATVVLSAVSAAGPGPFTGTTDAEGKFSLGPSVQPDQSGVVPGTYRLTISTIQVAPTEGGDEAVPKVLVEERVPHAYRSGNIRFEVPADGTQEADFALTSN